MVELRDGAVGSAPEHVESGKTGKRYELVRGNENGINIAGGRSVSCNPHKFA